MLFRDSLHSRAEARQFNYRNTSNMSGNITNQISEPQDDILTQTSTNKNTLAHTGPMRTYRCQLTGILQLQPQNQRVENVGLVVGVGERGWLGDVAVWQRQGGQVAWRSKAKQPQPILVARIPGPGALCADTFARSNIFRNLLKTPKQRRPAKLHTQLITK